MDIAKDWTRIQSRERGIKEKKQLDFVSSWNTLTALQIASKSAQYSHAVDRNPIKRKRSPHTANCSVTYAPKNIANFIVIDVEIAHFVCANAFNCSSIHFKKQRRTKSAHGFYNLSFGISVYIVHVPVDALKGGNIQTVHRS